LKSSISGEIKKVINILIFGYIILKKYEPMKFTYLTRNTKHLSVVAWRGERICFEISSIAGELADLENKDGNRIKIESSGLYATMANKIKVWDVIAPYRVGETQKLWITVDIPRNAQTGFYTSVSMNLTVQVLSLVLPRREDWSFHLDLWQNPWAVARAHHVPVWSDEHFLVLDRHLRVLADGGQKVITTTVVDDAWSGQTYDKHGSMVKWYSDIPRASIKNSDLQFDFTIFVRYVQCCQRAGIREQINVFSILPWGSDRGCGEKDGAAPYTIYDAEGQFQIKIIPGTLQYYEIWGAFLKAFAVVLGAHGWRDIVHFAFDERHNDEMKAALDMLERLMPDSMRPIKTASAYEYNNEYTDKITDLSPGINTSMDWNLIAQQRRDKGQKTTFYLCEWPKPPAANTFLVSPPHESRWVGWYAAANGLDGFLRWAYDSWPKDPLLSGDYPGPHGHWPAGDTFLSYPNGWGSRRFAMLRQGIQDFEKIKLLRQHRDLSDLLKPFIKADKISLSMMRDATIILGKISQELTNNRVRANFFVIRHGDRFDMGSPEIWKEKCKDGVYDHHDTPLSRDGHKQARITAQYLVKSGIVPDDIFSSPYLRTMQTAEEIADAFNIVVKVEKGLSEGYHRRVQDPEKRAAFPYLDLNYKSLVIPIDNEPYRDFHKRVNVLAHCFKENYSGTAFLISHAATSLAFAAGILNCDVKNLGQIGACEVIHVAVLENGSPYLLHKYTPHEIHGQTVPWGYN
jgi:broad specificity phosphatase PhoE